jgi:tetratricopeptide (TPR) repeat protein/uncharacterized protein YoaH (UPF0181 family)
VIGSVAPALLQSGVGSVIAFSHTVHVKAARLFVERFYKELTDGLSVGQALAEVRAQLRNDAKRWLHLGPEADSIHLEDWFVPQLYQVGNDPALMDAKGDRAAAEGREHRSNWTKTFHGFPPSPMYHFHGRASELLALERAFRSDVAILLCGMGGMGKTALARDAAAWWLRTRRFELAVFHSFEQKAGADRVIQILGEALEGNRFTARPADEQWPVAIEIFKRCRVLLVWDNFESTLEEFQRGEDGDPSFRFGQEERQRLRELYCQLTDGEPKGRILLTCRSEQPQLPGLRTMELKGLARPDSLHLLAAVLGRKGISIERKGYERDEVEELLNCLADHPLSISLVAPHLTTLTPSEIRRELYQDLERFADASAEEARNRSLLSSIEFSTRRLSDAARRVLPYLAWFEGGVVERNFANFAEVEAATWERVRSELVATGLMRVENLAELPTPFLHLHPTLTFVADHHDVGDEEAAETRFISIYIFMAWEVYQAFDSVQSVIGMALLEREEANMRSATQRAFRRGERQKGAAIADTLREYLERAGRVREGSALIASVREHLQQGAGLDIATCDAIRKNAMTLLNQGQTAAAVATVKGLIERLEAEGLTGPGDEAFEIATSYRRLGLVFVEARRPDLALEPAQRAISLLERIPGDHGERILSAALGDLTNSNLLLGRFDEALTAAKRALAIERQLGREREVAVAVGLIAKTLSHKRRYTEADARYSEAVSIAQQVRDFRLQAVLLQHRTDLNIEIGSFAQAVKLGKEALVLFQQAGDVEAQAQTCHFLGEAESELGHLDAAEAWFAKARELARVRQDRYELDS